MKLEFRSQGARRTAGWLGGALFLLLAGSVFAQAWPVANASGRIRVERAKKTPWPATVGYAQVWPGGADPLKCHASVLTAGGRKVGSMVIWAATGEPLKVLFDTSSGEITYDIYLHDGQVTDAGWLPQGGVTLETRAWKGGPLDTWDKAWKTVKTSNPVLGRSPEPNIFLGVHPHGATTNFCGHYSAWFQLKKAGDYEFAVLSTGPAYLRIDGKVVIQRPQMGGSRGRRGEVNGKITLSAGNHQMDYLFVHPGAGEWMAEAAWKQPDRPHFELMPKEAFLSLAAFDTFSYQPAPGRGEKGAFEWEPTEHSLAEGLPLITMQFRAVGGRKDAACRWQFDDGTTAIGSPVTHVFAQTGLRRVQFAAGDKGQPTTTLTEFVNVHPRWTQMEEWADGTFELQKKQLLAADFSAAPTEDLAALVNFADTVHDQALLSHLGPVCLKRQSEFKTWQADVLYLLGRHYMTPEVRDYVSSEKCYRAALSVSATNSSAREKSKLRLGHLLTDAFNKPAEALVLLQSINENFMMSDYIRQTRLYVGDALAAQGKIEEAAKNYRAAGDLVPKTNLMHSVRGSARLESARDFIKRSEFDFAEEILRQIEWETPNDRLSAETGLPMILVHLGRKEYPLALARCQRLLYSATVDTHRADVLYCLILTELALGQRDAAQETLTKLLKDHPYSEATARAKDRWGSRLGPDAK